MGKSKHLRTLIVRPASSVAYVGSEKKVAGSIRERRQIAQDPFAPLRDLMRSLAYFQKPKNHDQGMVDKRVGEIIALKERMRYADIDLTRIAKDTKATWPVPQEEEKK